MSCGIPSRSEGSLPSAVAYLRVSDHRAMVFDTQRNQAYFRALEAVISRHSTVMDLGAGLGVHGLHAASLGAASVCLVDPTPVIEIARQVAAANGLDNVSCFPCRVEELDIAQKFDVLVSVFTGNFLLTEDLLPSLFFARDNFLAPGGKMIPDYACMEVVPVMAADYYRKHIEVWSEGAVLPRGRAEAAINYEAARSYAANSLYYDTRERLGATPLADAVRLMELDLTRATRADCDHQVEVTLTRDGTCHGWLGWFQMRLLQEWFSTSGESSSHWTPVFLPLEHPLEVKAGESLAFALHRPQYGDWTWTTEYGGRRQRQSTFLSSPLTPAALLQASDTYRPELSARGKAAAWLLTCMAGGTSVAELAVAVMATHPDVFSSEEDALRFVKDLAGRYGQACLPEGEAP